MRHSIVTLSCQWSSTSTSLLMLSFDRHLSPFHTIVSVFFSQFPVNCNRWTIDLLYVHSLYHHLGSKIPFCVAENPQENHIGAWGGERVFTFQDSLIWYFMTDSKCQIISQVFFISPIGRCLFALWPGFWSRSCCLFSSILLLKTILKKTLLGPIIKAETVFRLLLW